MLSYTSDNIARVSGFAGFLATTSSLIAAALSEADPALLAAHVDPAAIRAGRPAEGKRPTRSAVALFLCDAFRCLPELASLEDAETALRGTRRGLAAGPALSLFGSGRG